MRIFGLEITKALEPVRANGQWGIFNTIRESFAGAWQSNVEVESTANMLTFSAIYACIALISQDISKLRPVLSRRRGDGTWQEVEEASPFWPVLEKPNAYQTRVQFWQHWTIHRLTHGNVYALKERDSRSIVTGFYLLDPRCVTPLVADNGDVYYEIHADKLARVSREQAGDYGRVIVPAADVVHDRCATLWHPLIGVPPIYACGMSATQGIRIQSNSAKFFENMSRPSGVLTAPGKISDETAERLKKTFESNFGSSNIGRILVAGDALKYEAMTIPAADAQLIEQLKWTGEDACRAFGVPLYKVGLGQNPTFNNIGALNQQYFDQALQQPIESIETLLNEGLRLPSDLRVIFDTEGLLRMDPLTRADYHSKAISAGYMKPNEARLTENMPPVPGGDTPYMQQQNVPLALLADIAKAATKPPAPALPAPDEEDDEETNDDQPLAQEAAAIVAMKELIVRMRELAPEVA